MIIPSIDLMGGLAVQLRQGREHVLTSPRDPLELAAEFNRYGEVAVIDLDAAMGRGDNLGLVREMCRVADVRAGGGVRDEKRGRELLAAGAASIIIGTAAEPDLLSAFPRDRVVVALDHRGGRVVDRGWTRDTGEDFRARAERLAPHCGGFLVTFVDREGGLGGMDMEEVRSLAGSLGRPVTVAGGVAGTAEAAEISKLGADVQVGMALYTGRLDLAEAVVRSLDFGKAGGLMPTVVQDGSGQVLMLAYSSPESLARALREGKGVYWSRSRNEIWEKGAVSGSVQSLVSCRADCDRDALLFTVSQTGPACHAGTYSCFGRRRFGLGTLFGILGKRKAAMPDGSYTATLFKDRTKLLRKIMEEAFEVAIAKGRRETAWEISDLVYFLGALAVDEGLGLRDIEAELSSRHRGED